MGFWKKLFGAKGAASGGGEAVQGAPAAWRKAFAERREAFIQSLRDAVAGAEVAARYFDAEDGYQPFAMWEDGKLVRAEQGTLADAEGFLRHLIDEGHKVAYAVSREGEGGAKAVVCVSYDGDQADWSPEWPGDFRVDVSRTSEPMTETW